MEALANASETLLHPSVCTHHVPVTLRNFANLTSPALYLGLCSALCPAQWSAQIHHSLLDSRHALTLDYRFCRQDTAYSVLCLLETCKVCITRSGGGPEGNRPSVDVLDTETPLTLNPMTCIAGSGAGPEGNRPFLDVLDTETQETHRLWQSSPPYLEDLGSIITDKHDEPIK